MIEWARALRRLRSTLVRSQPSTAWPSAPPMALPPYYDAFTHLLNSDRTRDTPSPAHALFPRHTVLIIGDLDDPLRKRYRVLQKIEILQSHGIAAHYSHWRDIPRTLDLMQLATTMILCNPAVDDIFSAYVAEARRLGIQIVLDVDTDPSHQCFSRTGGSDTLDAIDAVIAGTPFAQSSIQMHYNGPLYLWPTLIDNGTLHASRTVLTQKTDTISVGCLSGIRGTDLREIAPPVANAMRLNERMELTIIGSAHIPDVLAPWSKRIRLHAASHESTLLSAINTVDALLIPKQAGDVAYREDLALYFLPSMLGVPSVMSRAGASPELVKDENVLLADTHTDWSAALDTLMSSRPTRVAVGASAKSWVVDNFSASGWRVPHNLLRQPTRGSHDPKRAVVTNVYFAPTSFGGATVQVENIAQTLAADHGWQILVATAFQSKDVPPYTKKRYKVGNVDVLGVCVPAEHLSFEQTYDNIQFGTVFAEIIRAFAPSSAHIQCIQTMGMDILRILRAADIPFAVTFHDCWWLCERIFMVNSQSSYCMQTTIDFDVCRYCVVDIERTKARHKALIDTLSTASLFLFPSEFHRDLHIANGFDENRCVVNKNGIQLPGIGFTKRPIHDPNIRLRFGFVGGPGPIKGADQILQAFRHIERSDYELVVVNAAQNIGRNWVDDYDWSVPGKLRVHPAYTASTMDDFYQAIDVLLFPSQWKESFGLTVREALARDIWVVTSDAGGAAEDCIDGVNSTIVPLTPDHRPLQNAIESLLETFDPLSYRNPQSDAIVSLSDQAAELSLLLDSMRGRRRIHPIRTRSEII